MKILYVEDDDSIRQVYTIYLENLIQNLELKEVASGNDAIELLRQGNTYDIIISDYHMPNGTGGDLYIYLKKNNLTTPFVLFSTDPIESHNEFNNFFNEDRINLYIKKPIDKKNFSKKIESLIKTSGKLEEDKQFTRVRLIYFYRFNKVCCDVFIKLSDSNFVKIFTRDTIYSRFDIEKYYKKGIQHLYIHTTDHSDFSKQLGQTPFLTIDLKDKTDAQKDEVLISAHVVVSDLLKTVGITKAAIEVANSYIEEIQKRVVDNKDLIKLIKRMKKRNDYLFDHSLMVASFATKLCEILTWDASHEVQKLCSAALFHDITLDDANLARIKTLKDPRLKKFSKKQISSFEEHPTKAAELIRKIPDIAMKDVETIVLQHHERPDGSGFPRGITNNYINNLAALFIVAHDFVDELYDIDFDEKQIAFIFEKIKSNFQSGVPRNIVNALSKIIQQNL